MLVGLVVNLIAFVVLIISIVIHEVSHGYVAYYFGDNTAKRSGRLTLNPLKHIDPAGTILIPLLLRLAKSPVVFGWAKPVPINSAKLRDPESNMLWVSLAGPFSNIILGLLLALLGRMVVSLTNTNIAAPIEPMSVLLGATFTIIQAGVLYNFFLAFFNLIPIPPLDGSRVLRFFMPLPVKQLMDKIEPYGFLILFIALYYLKDMFNHLYSFVINITVLLLY